MRIALPALAVGLVLLAIGFLASRLIAQQDATISVNPKQTYQSMDGWEVTARVSETNKKEDRFDPSWETHSGELLHLLANELGINRVRIEIKSGAENPVDYWALFRDGKIGYREYKSHYYEKINDNDEPDVADPAGFQFSALDYQMEKIVLPLAKLVESNGEKLYVNLNYVDFGGLRRSNLSHAQSPEEYAELIYMAFDHLKRRYGLTPDALEIVLEPENTDHWRGRQIGEAMVAVAKRLEPAGFSPAMIAPSTTAASAAPRYFDEIVQVPGASALLSELSYHRYRDLIPNNALPEIARRARKLGVRTAMLEHVGGDADELHSDLTLANASAWQQYGIAAELGPEEIDGGGFYYLHDAGREGSTIRMAKRTRGLAQYFRFVRAGAVRIGATSSDSDALPVAFRNADGTSVVIVNARRPGRFSVTGMPAGSYGLRYTTDLETGRELPAVTISDGQPLQATLPAPGIMTLYRKKSP